MTGALLGLLLATTPITLDQVRAQSRDNLQALSSVLDAERAMLQATVVRSGLLPSLALEIGALGQIEGPQQRIITRPDPSAESGFSVDRVVTETASYGNFSLAATVRQLLYDGGQWARVAAAGAASEAARGEALEQADASELEGIRRFYALLRAQKAVDVIRDSIRRSEQQVAAAESYFRAGRAPQSDVLNARINLGNDRINEINEAADLNTARMSLAVWIGREPTEALEAVDPGLGAELPSPPETSVAVEQALTRRPLLVALQERIRVAESERDAARSAYWPRLYAQATYARRGPGADVVFTEPRLQNSLSGGAFLEWNIFNGLADQAQVGIGETNVRQARETFLQTKRDLEGEVINAIGVFNRAVYVARISDESRTLAAQNLALINERFSAGLATQLDVRDSESKLTQAELTYLSSRMDVEVARATLERVMGTLSGGKSS